MTKYYSTCTDDRGWARWRNRKKILPQLLIDFNHKCHWCDITVVVTPEKCSNQATVDHLKTRRQGRKDYMDGGHVLACHKCNHERGAEECRALTEARSHSKIKHASNYSSQDLAR